MEKANILPSPDFSYDASSLRVIAGLRPYRNGTYRLELEKLGNKFVVHNYGHGGAGITMSWGCAYEVQDIVNALSFSQGTAVAVIGAGVMGLTCSTLLVDMGLKVSIFAKDFIPNTTSNVAGGQWAPSKVNYLQTPDGTNKFRRILTRAFKTHESKIGSNYGVSKRPNYTRSRSTTFGEVPRDLIPDPIKLDHLPFEHLTAPGFVYNTLLVEPPIFLQKLHDDLLDRGVKFVRKEFNSPQEIAQLDERTVINCSGLGSKTIWQDEKLEPVKGQLALLKAQPELKYLYSADGYVFPRTDHVVVGGTYEHSSDPTPHLKMCEQLVAHASATFDGAALIADVIPDWLYRFE